LLIRQPVRTLSSPIDLYFGLYGIGDEALFMGGVMQAVLLGGGRSPLSAVGNARAERDRTDPGHARIVLRHRADRFIVVAVHLESLFARQMKKRDHVAAGN